MSSLSPSLVEDLKTQPLHRPEQLGEPIPASTHAVSVALPTWQNNVGYEEGDPDVVERLKAGYPRFVYHPLCRQFFAACLARWGEPGEDCLAFPTAASAARFSDWMQRRARVTPRVVPRDDLSTHLAFFRQAVASEAKAFWQHSGEGVSSRRAEAALASLNGVTPARFAGTIDARRILRDRLANLVGVSSDDVYLFPCGMNAAFQLHQVLVELFPGRRSVQFGFPYVDTLKIQEKLGPGAVFFPRGDADELTRLAGLLRTESISGLYTEFPSNPLLASPDLPALVELSRRYEFPLIVDDTVASSANVELLAVADVVWMSLTKYFSGTGDVTGGAIVVNPVSRFSGPIREALNRRYDDLMFDPDVDALERNSRDFAPRIQAISRNAERLADHLRSHPAVETVYYPKFRTPQFYEPFRRPAGGYGGLLSVDLKDAPRRAPRFFDALRVCKGPNLGMAYTLACPYTILAHYTELDFAESAGVSRWLIRVSVGTEDPAELIKRFDEALATTADARV